MCHVSLSARSAVRLHFCVHNVMAWLDRHTGRPLHTTVGLRAGKRRRGFMLGRPFVSYPLVSRQDLARRIEHAQWRVLKRLFKAGSSLRYFLSIVPKDQKQFGYLHPYTQSQAQLGEIASMGNSGKYRGGHRVDCTGRWICSGIETDGCISGSPRLVAVARG